MQYSARHVEQECFRCVSGVIEIQARLCKVGLVGNDSVACGSGRDATHISDRSKALNFTTLRVAESAVVADTW
jgi:hypothetical protein